MKLKNAIILSALAGAAYYVVNGTGVLNKIRFKEQHECIANYLGTSHPGATFVPITATETGWCTVFTTTDGKQIPLYVTKSADGHYIFSEGEPV